MPLSWGHDRADTLPDLLLLLLNRAGVAWCRGEGGVLSFLQWLKEDPVWEQVTGTQWGGPVHTEYAGRLGRGTVSTQGTEGPAGL